MKKVALYLFFVASAACRVHAQQVDDLLDWNSHTTLYNYITHTLHDQYVRRDSVLDVALRDNTLAAYQEACRKHYLGLLGSFPEKSPLNAEITGTLQRDGYRIQKVVYQSLPNHHVTANLYLPEGKGPFPGILFFCGHEAPAKATPTYQETCILFARHGFAVLAIDPVSQGERYQLTGPAGQPLTRGGTTAHTLLASGSNLVGTSVAAYELWDNERGLDYLCSLKEVDTSRIGCLGNSGGGTQTAYFIPYDPRIKVAAICSYTTRRERTLELLGPQDGCQWLPGESRAGLDISDYAVMFAPKPLLILAGRYDFVDYNGVKDVYGELKKVYANLRHPEKIKLFSYDNGHGIQEPKQEVAVQWFRRWLYDDTSAVEAQSPAILTESRLNVTKTGQVNAAFKEEYNIQDHNLYLADQWKARRKELLKESTPGAYRTMLTKVLGLQPGGHAADAQQVGIFTKDKYRVQKFILRKSGEPPLPFLLAYGRPGGGLMIVLDGAGKKAALENDSLLSSLHRKGYSVLLADLRGLGELSDEPGKNPAKYNNNEYRNAMLALFTGRSLPAQRTEDILSLLDYSKTDTFLSRLPVEITASGPAAEAALFAAALNTEIRKVTLYSTVRSFYTFLKDPLAENQYSYVVPGALHYFDLPQLAEFAGRDRIKYVE